MKKLITTIVLSIIMVSLTNAQIKKPTVKVNTTSIKTNTNLQGIKVNDLSRLKSIEDFEKLKIPPQQLTKEILNAKPTQTWKIGPRRLNDGNLKFEQIIGVMTPTSWLYGGEFINNLDDVIEDLNRDIIRGGNYATFPLSIKFKVSGGIEYRLKFKQLQPASTTNNNEYLYVYIESKNGRYISRLDKNDLNEFNFIFKEPNSSEIILKISPIPNLKGNNLPGISRSGYYWQWVEISEIKIDRIN